MTLIFKLAYRNLLGSGLKTWLKVAVLSLAYVLITWHYGFFSGMYRQAARAMIDDEIGGGQYWHENYDPYDPLTLDDSHGPLPGEIKSLVDRGKAVPILIRPASIFPQGRMQQVLLKGIDPAQDILGIPAAKLGADGESLPLLIGKRMARSGSLKKGDYIMLRWRDSRGAFDAAEGRITEIMETQVPAIDSGQLWVPIDRLREMTMMEDEATIAVVKSGSGPQPDYGGWKFRDTDFLLKDITAIVNSKKISAGIMYLILLFLAMIAIFDTQILSIFRRRKEIGTLMALGLTRFDVIALFTLEGALIGVLALGVSVIFGTPVLYLTATRGISFPSETIDDYGVAIPSKLYPAYSAGLIIGTVLLIMGVTLVVSYLPTRRISKLKPTEALKGKMS
ncbi:MAG: ABC transporter permease [Elusimicrobia bacterium]|nr:ABC transporter permease [Elusimicrobiota bacterium]